MTLKDAPDRDGVADCLEDTAPRSPKSKTQAAKPPRKTEPPAQAEPVDRLPSGHEMAAARRFLERREHESALSQITFAVDHESKAVTPISSNHANDSTAGRLAIMDTFATGYYEFSDALLCQLIRVARNKETGKVDERKLAQSIATVQAIGPRNEVEAMLAVQMAAVHNATMGAAGTMADGYHFRNDFKEASASLVKLSRTFAAQVDALRNWRLNGTQHIHVHHHRPEAPGGNRHEASDLSDRELADIARGVGGKTENWSQTHEPRRPYPAPECSSPLYREVKEIAAGLPRPSNARP